MVWARLSGEPFYRMPRPRSVVKIRLRRIPYFGCNVIYRHRYPLETDRSSCGSSSSSFTNLDQRLPNDNHDHRKQSSMATAKVLIAMADYGHDPTGTSSLEASRTLAHAV